jgi:hypothetical protein
MRDAYDVPAARLPRFVAVSPSHTGGAVAVQDRECQSARAATEVQTKLHLISLRESAVHRIALTEVY